MEYATRAQALTSRFFGETEELLPKYARTAANSRNQPWPVGSLKPNDMGFFDVHGNVSSWSLESYQIYTKALVRDAGGDLLLALFEPGAPRGGWYLDRPADVRSAARQMVAPSERLPRLVSELRGHYFRAVRKPVSPLDAFWCLTSSLALIHWP